MKSMKQVFMMTFLIGMMMFATSCFLSKPVPYFKGGLDTTQLQNITIPDQLIQKGDILNITVYSDNPEATNIFNQAGGVPPTGSTSPISGTRGNMMTTNSTATGGYLVDNAGNIRMHAIGVLNVEGLTRQQLEELVTAKLRKLDVLQNPYCIIRHTNFKIIVLGEVTNPGVFTIPSEKASVLEALGLAGDITTFGRKDNVMLIRENSGKRSYYSINLTDPMVFASPNFYLRQNDVLVIQADDKKPTASDQQMMQALTLGLTVVTSLTLLINLFR
jgi:polysaccharide export outer membrane protein